MNSKNVPEMSRITYFESGDIVQIFGENFDKETKLYIWQAEDKNNSTDTVLDFYEGDRNAYKIALAKARGVDAEELNDIEGSMPDLPPEEALVFDADNAFENCIYFGDKEPVCEPGQPVKRIPKGTGIFWLKNDAGFSKPMIANRPEIWNTSFDKIRRGDHIMAFGDKFGFPTSFNDGTHWSKRGAVKSTETGKVYSLEGVEETGYLYDCFRYIAEFNVPEDIPAGKYEFSVHSGMCGKFGWSKPVEIEITDSSYNLNYYLRNRFNRCTSASLAMPKCKVITINADDASPFADYHGKIQAAIDSFGNEDGMVVLSAGAFPISKTINLKPNVALIGSGVGTVIRASESIAFEGDVPKDAVFADKGYGLKGWSSDYIEHIARHKTGIAIRLCGQSGVESLKIELGNGINIAMFAVDHRTQNLDDVFVNKVEVDNNGLTELEHDGYYMAMNSAFISAGLSKNLTIWGCKFTALEPIFITPARHTYAKIINNEFHCRPRQMAESMIAGIRHSMVVNNLFEGGRRSFVGNDGCSHNWIYQNRSTDVNRAGCACEAYMSEHGNGEWNGHGVGFGKDYVDIVSDTDIMFCSFGAPYTARFNSYERFLFIYNGRGLGQYRKITDVIEEGNNKHLVLESEWDVIPDETTAFTIVYGTHHNLWIDNNTSLSNGHSQFVWNCGFENIISGHCMEVSAGMRMQAYHGYSNPDKGFLVNVDDKPKKHTFVALLAFNRFSHCQTKASGMGLRVQANMLGNEDAPEWADFRKTRGVFGNTVEQCAFDGSNDTLNYVKNLCWLQEKPVLTGILFDGAYNLMEKNFIFGYEKAITFLGDCPGNFVTKNTFRGVKEAIAGRARTVGKDSELFFNVNGH